MPRKKTEPEVLQEETVQPETTQAEETSAAEQPVSEPQAEEAVTDASTPPYGEEELIPTEEATESSETEKKSFYDLDFRTLDQGLLPEQRQEWNTIYASFRGRSVMHGTIIGVDPHTMTVRSAQTGLLETKQMYCAVVVPFRVRILIPETEMWAENEERPAFVLRNMPGAQIDFVITHVDREEGFAIGSRRLALHSRRYFFSTQPLCQPGSRVLCHVLAVGPRRCLVECYGYDVNLSQRDISYAAIPDLREQYHPGDELTCVVKQFDREAGSLEISIKETVPNPFDEACLRHPVDCRRRAIIAGKYAGGVFCNLPDGAVIMCRYSFQYEDSDFKTGDTVMVVIQRYDQEKKQIFGKIVGR